MIIPETYLSVHQQLSLLGLSVAFGAAFGIVFDFFRALRIALPHNKLLVAAEDIIFMLFYSVFIISFTSAAALGQFRFFYVIGNLIGFTLYFFTVGSVVIRIFRSIFSASLSVLRFILFPFRLFYVRIFTKISSKFVAFAQIIAKCYKIKKRLLIEHTKMLYNSK